LVFADPFSVDPAWVLTTFVALGGVISGLFYIYKAQVDKQITDLQKQLEETKQLNKTLYSVAEEGAKSALTMANYIRAKEGKPPVPLVAPVVPEGNSPPNATQREAALLATMRANLAAVKLATGQEARKEPTSDPDGSK
jgi:hypothetical protein